jgi:hypothetical protein
MKPGWLDRELRAIKEDARTWPEWMKRGTVVNSEETLIRDLVAALEALLCAIVGWHNNGLQLADACQKADAVLQRVRNRTNLVDTQAKPS